MVNLIPDGSEFQAQPPQYLAVNLVLNQLTVHIIGQVELSPHRILIVNNANVGPTHQWLCPFVHPVNYQVLPVALTESPSLKFLSAPRKSGPVAVTYNRATNRAQGVAILPVFLGPEFKVSNPKFADILRH